MMTKASKQEQLERLKDLLQRIDPELTLWVEYPFIKIGNRRTFRMLELRSIKQAIFLLELLEAVIELMSKEV
jgi:hypothetical protein